MEIETKRLLLREIKDSDFIDLTVSLKDAEVMYAWEHSFSDEEIITWIDKRKKGYKSFGYDYFLAIDKERNTAIGQIGLLNEEVGDAVYLGLGWILNRTEWGKGYAVEGAKALIDYAFNTLNKKEIIAKIRTENQKSINVAKRLGMIEIGVTEVFYNDKIMPHKIFSLKKEN